MAAAEEVAVRTRERAAERGELCSCGRQAVVVFLTEKFGPVGWCGQSDRGSRDVHCPFCGTSASHERWRGQEHSLASSVSR